MGFICKFLGHYKTEEQITKHDMLLLDFFFPGKCVKETTGKSEGKVAEAGSVGRRSSRSPVSVHLRPSVEYFFPYLPFLDGPEEEAQARI